jgi:peptide/nickel transport system substrate-binding protein
VFQLGWFPDFPDADNYLAPFVAPYDKKQPGNFTFSHYNENNSKWSDPTMSKWLDEQRTESDEDARAAKLKQIQNRLAEQVPFLPLLTGTQVAVARDGVTGADKTLDASFKFRFTSLSKK